MDCRFWLGAVGRLGRWAAFPWRFGGRGCAKASAWMVGGAGARVDRSQTDSERLSKEL